MATVVHNLLNAGLYLKYLIQIMALWLKESCNLSVITQLILGRAESWTQFFLCVDYTHPLI